jgi:hypothetical protein
MNRTTEFDVGLLVPGKLGDDGTWSDGELDGYLGAVGSRVG